MQRHIIFIIYVCFLFACNKKTIPSKTATTIPAPPATVITTVNPKPIDSPTVAIPPIKPALPVPSAMIVIDGYGRILTPQSKLPNDPGIKPDYSKIARAFTPQEIANLKARFNTVPPKVLYVPEQYAVKTYRGTYCIYKKKFWYWKKEDGLFYLNETDYK